MWRGAVAGAITVGLAVAAAAPARADTVVFREDFSAAGLDPARWGVAHWRLGRTDLANRPLVTGGIARLPFDTWRFRGTEIFTKASFARGAGLTISARMRVVAPPPGLVAALFTYTYDQARGVSDEIDIEILTKPALAGPGADPLLLSTWNDWDEARPAYQDGIHHRALNRRPEGFDIRRWHVYTIRWLAGRAEWSVDGRRVAVTDDAVPDRATPVRINLWAPAASWADAYAAGLQPAASAAQNRRFFLDVDWVELRRP